MNSRFRLSVRPSVCHIISIFSFHRIITKFSGDIAMDKSDIRAKGQGQESKAQRSKQILPQFELF